MRGHLHRLHCVNSISCRNVTSNFTCFKVNRTRGLLTPTLQSSQRLVSTNTPRSPTSYRVSVWLPRKAAGHAIPNNEAKPLNVHSFSCPTLQLTCRILRIEKQSNLGTRRLAGSPHPVLSQETRMELTNDGTLLEADRRLLADPYVMWIANSKASKTCARRCRSGR